MVGNLVTDASGNNDAGVRWFELRKSGASTGQFIRKGPMHPIAMVAGWDRLRMDGDGNIALGYNVSGSATFPSLRYAGRLAGDPLGTLPQGRYVIVNGSGVNGSSRYGDYAAMSIDPIDDCTFWFTGEYNATSQWSTRIAAFRFDECGGGGTDTVISQDQIHLQPPQLPRSVSGQSPGSRSRCNDACRWRCRGCDLDITRRYDYA